LTGSWGGGLEGGRGGLLAGGQGSGATGGSAPALALSNGKEKLVWVIPMMKKYHLMRMRPYRGDCGRRLLSMGRTVPSLPHSM
jgi:hypothetical protein